jgi:hypothetical protein
MAMVHAEAPVLDPAVAIDVEGVDGGLGHLVLKLTLEVRTTAAGRVSRLHHEVAPVDEGARNDVSLGSEISVDGLVQT